MGMVQLLEEELLSVFQPELLSVFLQVLELHPLGKAFLRLCRHNCSGSNDPVHQSHIPNLHT